jgi:hypothetical protein
MCKALAAAVILILTGCNDVHSARPLIHDADGAPVFRPGLWVGLDKACPLDTALPVEKWPSCATAMVIRPGRITGATKADRRGLMTYRLSGRLPTLVQIRSVRDDSGHLASADSSSAKLGTYQYLGLAVLGADEQGLMTQVAFWSALCGPDPAPAKPGESPRYVTDKPLPGMTVIGNACTTTSLDAVRGAVIASKGWSMPLELRWVRDKP